jgi:hypothetical protein|uniref:Uncharacterized protein n=1 Tax=Picea glauca TaxID=3330 RepID=A0A101M5Z4_PICGL|nr:hypothetical protein ABT39_MTgene1268 [Picea glauca]
MTNRCSLGRSLFKGGSEAGEVGKKFGEDQSFLTLGSSKLKIELLENDDPMGELTIDNPPTQEVEHRGLIRDHLGFTRENILG